MEQKLLEVKGVNKSYPGVQALKDVDFDLVAGEVHALVGENGAGKSTLVKVIAGIVESDDGKIFINGEKVIIKDPHHARKLGIATVFQELSQIPTLSVAENVFLGKELNRTKCLLDRKSMIHRTREILGMYDIDLDPRERIADLSTAKRQLAEIVKALEMEPNILIMDEPTSSLTESEAESLFSIIEDFQKKGVGIIYVTHKMNEVFTIADRVTILRDGNFIDVSGIEEIDMDGIVNKMVGREVDLYESTERVIDYAELNPTLRVKNLTRKGDFKDVTFDLYKGEILGVAGLVGSGRSELVNTIFGVLEKDSGEILLNSSRINISSVRDALEHGIALIPEDRHEQGLVLQHSILQNIILPVMEKFKDKGLIRYERARKFVQKKIDQFNIKPSNEKKVVNFLSGGNQQKVVVAKWLSTDPKILIVDELTSGIDVRTKAEIHKLIRDLTEEGHSIIMISSEMPELLAHSDRIMVMNKGRVLEVFEDTNQEEIMSIIMEDNIKRQETEEKNTAISTLGE